MFPKNRPFRVVCRGGISSNEPQRKCFDDFLLLMIWHVVRYDTGQHLPSPGLMVGPSPQTTPSLAGSYPQKRSSLILINVETSGKGPITLLHTGWRPLGSCLFTIAQVGSQAVAFNPNTRHRAAVGIQQDHAHTRSCFSVYPGVNPPCYNHVSVKRKHAVCARSACLLQVLQCLIIAKVIWGFWHRFYFSKINSA